MALHSLIFEEADLQLLEPDPLSSSPTQQECREFPEKSHLSPTSRVASPVSLNPKSCCVCVVPLHKQDSSSRSESQDEEFSYFDKIDTIDVIEGDKLFKILDIQSLLLMHENEKCRTYPICRPCYIEITKYEKLQTEIQRIVDQIVTTVLENLEFQRIGTAETEEGQSDTFQADIEDPCNPNPLQGLRDLIFQRWKPQDYHSSISSDHDVQSSSSTSSSIMKAIFQTLELQPHEIIPPEAFGIDENDAILLRNSNKDCDFLSTIIPHDDLNNSGPSQDRPEGSCQNNLSSVSPKNLTVDGILHVDNIDDECEDSLKSHYDRRGLGVCSNGPFICTKCKKEFRQQRDLDVHIRRQHTGERPFICNICEKAYPAKSALHHHQKIHSQRFICDVCGAAVVTETGLKKHMQIHDGIKPFVCDICSKTFMWKQSLLKHQVLHTDVKPFSCELCDKSFAIKDYLDKHIGRRHPMQREGQVAVLTCPYCQSTKYRTPGNLSAHILRKHSSASASFV